MADPLLEHLLAEASLSRASRDAIAQAYPTLDDLLSATLAEIADVAGADEASRLWEVLEGRWRYEAIGTDLGRASAVSGLAQIIEATSTDERPESLRVQLQVLALLDATMRAAGFDPDAP